MMATGYDSSLAPTESGASTGAGRWLATALVLAAGWGALFAYSTTYLGDDLPIRAPSTLEATRNDGQAFDFAAVRIQPVPPSPAAERRIDEVVKPAQDAVIPAPARPSGEIRLLTDVKPVDAALPPPSAPIVPRERAEYVGLWGPTPAACGAPSRRRGYIQARISHDRAQAGRTICSFRDGHRAGNAWVVAADCTDRGRRWTSQVRLLVDGDQLTWTSGKGSSQYVRCNRRG